MRSLSHRIVAYAVALLACAPLMMAAVSYTERIAHDFPMEPGGSFWIDNPFGNIDIVGADGQQVVSVTAVKTVIATDASVLKDGREQTQVLMGGDPKVRVVRSVIPQEHDPHWKSSVSYVVRVPRNTHVKVSSNSSEHVHVSNVAGQVTVKNTNGMVVLDGITGSVNVDSINGSIHFDTNNAKPTAPVQLSTINGQIEVQVNGESNFEWFAETLKGDFLTNLAQSSVRGRFSGTAFRGLVNSSGGPTITTASITGNIYLLRKGSRPADVRSLRTTLASDGSELKIHMPPVKETIQTPFVGGNFIYGTNFGNFFIGEIRGMARIQTGAGQVTLGTVTSDCTVISGGGPLDLGDIFGVVSAHTDAGDVLVRSARRGGEVSTGGGILRVMFSGGPITMHSQGGDIILQTGAGPIIADTPSGDITLNVDATQGTQRVTAKTMRGNVVLTASPRFAADVDATVLTSDNDTDPITSDYNGLTIKRDQVNGRTRVHATGKVNGGGERVELYAEEGEIHLGTQGQ
jgi:DUF4097 and DUF4098 domain-containing protein YvlB